MLLIQGENMITITAFDWVPDFARGLVRDLRVRWALEEAGLEYQVKFITHEEKLTPAYRALQPFSQVPSYRDDDVTLFESGAIVLHIARHCTALLPADDAGRARATAWMFAALNSIEPFIMTLVSVDIFNREAPWAKESRPHWEAMVKKRLSDLAERLNGREWLEDRFTAGDLMMATVLRILRHTDLVTSDATLAPYLAHCEARPAFQKALADQLASFKESDARPAA
jgi:glutathione S-transferase